MDKVYVFSVAPYVAVKASLPYGPMVHVAAKPAGERYARTEIISSTCFKDFGNDQREYFPVPADGIVKDVLRDCGDQGVWWSESPDPVEADIVTAEAKQKAFYEKAVEDADAEWAKNGDPRKIGMHARLAVRELNLMRDWAKDTSLLTPCKSCKELISNSASKCPKCQAILNWEAARDMGLLSNDQIDFATRRGLLEPEAPPAKVKAAK